MVLKSFFIIHYSRAEASRWHDLRRQSQWKLSCWKTAQKFFELPKNMARETSGYSDRWRRETQPIPATSICSWTPQKGQAPGFRPGLLRNLKNYWVGKLTW